MAGPSKHQVHLTRNGAFAWPKKPAPDHWAGTVSALFFGVILFVTALGTDDQAMAESFEAGGLLFSDELGGFRLISASGDGTPSDPIILVEELLSLQPAVLTIRPSRIAKDRSLHQGVLRRSLVKVIMNQSSWRWSGFDLELRDQTGQASLYSDGLSFDQPSLVREPLHSDRFADNHIQDEPFDRLRFDQGFVATQDSVRLSFSIVDVNSLPVFYLAQEPIILMTRKDPSPNQRLAARRD
ncbi:MAG: hypothetical protein AAGA73_03240 [Pseudomonadota bacterium]